MGGSAARRCKVARKQRVSEATCSGLQPSKPPARRWDAPNRPEASWRQLALGQGSAGGRAKVSTRATLARTRAARGGDAAQPCEAGATRHLSARRAHLTALKSDQRCGRERGRNSAPAHPSFLTDSPSGVVMCKDQPTPAMMPHRSSVQRVLSPAPLNAETTAQPRLATVARHPGPLGRAT